MLIQIIEDFYGPVKNFYYVFWRRSRQKIFGHLFPTGFWVTLRGLNSFPTSGPNSGNCPLRELIPPIGGPNYPASGCIRRAVWAYSIPSYPAKGVSGKCKVFGSGGSSPRILDFFYLGAALGEFPLSPIFGSHFRPVFGPFFGVRRPSAAGWAEPSPRFENSENLGESKI